MTKNEAISWEISVLGGISQNLKDKATALEIVGLKELAHTLRCHAFQIQGVKDFIENTLSNKRKG